ncbi:MAG: hypothetical protein B7Z15_00505 [Rhizobiales bacterium 32-66-8]|nr:MAG: hypothetical protein B7Z15_00505 [Rhizobiales bacterium 32-66-8]
MLLGLALLTHRLNRQETAEGPARAVDGDSLALGDLRVRLAGIDAPELAQTCGSPQASWPCGRAAQAHLADLVRGRAVACAGEGHDAYARPIATCTVSRTISPPVRTRAEASDSPRDLGGALVEAGLAVARDRGAYGAQEAQARQAGRGIWSGPFDPPETWRADHPR